MKLRNKMIPNRARITRVLDLKDKETEKFGVAIQKKKGGRFNSYLAENNKMYVTTNKSEVIQKVKQVNKQLQELRDKEVIS
ncbi:hypothetical protein [Plebeiibacterium sediminum]|uniref:Uncharacterized protein n=1 Tax=Plebeiibacterium sediminum TaxID=2992112 RepID=A0AAE3SEC3_9BACT|nr:hypothetical protein [Plebeiobacterium sediminum]MCW3784908.1 hypothetical protein [Plebeiobacterium sediminum]